MQGKFSQHGDRDQVRHWQVYASEPDLRLDLETNDSPGLHRPAISPNGRILAVVAPDPRIHLLDLTDAVHGDNAITRLRLPPNAKAFLQDCHIIRWSPEFMLDDDADSTTTSEADLGTTWLLLSDGKRVIAMSTDIRLPRMMPGVDGDTGSKSNILADYDLGGQFGNLTLLEFVFDHRHALLMYEHGGSATLLSLTRPQREEISNVKHTGSTAFAQAPDANRFALLRRDEGQDKISVFELSSNSVPVQHAFEPRTSDAQGVMWCPAGQPILAVYDAPSYGLNVTFYTAQGHALEAAGHWIDQYEPGQTAFECQGDWNDLSEVDQHSQWSNHPSHSRRTEAGFCSISGQSKCGCSRSCIVCSPRHSGWGQCLCLAGGDGEVDTLQQCFDLLKPEGVFLHKLNTDRSQFTFYRRD